MFVGHLQGGGAFSPLIVDDDDRINTIVVMYFR